MSAITRGLHRILSLRKASAFLILAVSLGLLTGMANAPVEQGQAPALQSEAIRPLIDSALSAIEFSYGMRNLSGMMDLLDSDFEGWLEFKSNLEAYFHAHKDLQVHFVVDSYLTDKDKISVRLHWLKKSIEPGGAFLKSEGNSQFVFRRYPEGLKLLYIRQDNPFF